MNDDRNCFEPASFPNTVTVPRDQPLFCEVWTFSDSDDISEGPRLASVVRKTRLV